jgi:hypothetical protein
MNEPLQLLSLDEARALLAEMGVILNERQIQRAAEPNAAGERKLPFFVDPIEGRLRIEKNALLRVYSNLLTEAENKAIYTKNIEYT